MYKHKKFLCLFLLLVICLMSLPLTVRAETFEDLPCWPELDDINSNAYAIYDATAGEFLAEYNMHEKLSNASTTKMLTALTAVKHPDFDLDAKLLVSTTATLFISPEAVRLQLKPGELITTRDCLASMLVLSANDSARVLAENYGGYFGYSTGIDTEYWDKFTDEEALKSREAFMVEVNKMADDLGLEDTYFENPCGFEGENHGTTARDLAIIAEHLLENDLLAHYVSLPHYMPSPTNKHPYAAWSMLTNSNRLVVYGTEFFQTQYYKEYNGVKTGTTSRAGNCLVGSGITSHNHQIIAVLLGGSVYRPDDYSYISIAIPVRTLLEYGAYLSGAPKLSEINEQTIETEATTVASSTSGIQEVESTKASESYSSLSEALTQKNQASNRESVVNAEVHSNDSTITKRERLTIALCAIIVAAVLLLWFVSYRFGKRK